MEQNDNLDDDMLNKIPYVNNEFIKNAFEHYNNLPPIDKKIITDYKSEMDPDDWNDNPLDIAYNVINWILLQTNKNRKLSYTPELLESGVLTKKQFMNQIWSAKKLFKILSNFPKIVGNDSIQVYRGDTSEMSKFIISNKKKQITLYSFLSTSVNISVAKNFSRGCLLCIEIPSGNPIPFISDKLTMNYNFNVENSDTSESEVLLQLGCTFKFIKNYDININDKKTNVIYLELLSFGPRETRNFWDNYITLADELYEKIQIEKIEYGGKYTKRKKNKKIIKHYTLKKYKYV